jgi:dihydrofolate reductase
MLLEPIGKRTVISSAARGINQHNALNWRVEQSKFMPGSMSTMTKLLEQTLETWLADFPLAKRQLFGEALFDILGASEGRTIDPRESLKDLKNILTKYSKLDNETKALLTDVFSSLTARTKDTLSATIMENLPKIG